MALKQKNKNTDQKTSEEKKSAGKRSGLLEIFYVAALSFCILFAKGAAKIFYYSLVAVIEWLHHFWLDTREIFRVIGRELLHGALKILIAIKGIIRRTIFFNREKDGFVVASLFAAGCVTLSVGFFSTYTFGLKVLCSDQVIGSVQNTGQFEKILLEFEQKVADELGGSYRSPLKFDYRFALVRKDDEGDIDQIEQEVLKLSPDIDRFYTLKVDGKILAANNDKSEIEGVLEEILALNSTGGEEKIEFTRDVEIEYQLCREDLVRDAQELRVMLVAPTMEEKEITHSVQKGETIAIIAKKYGVSEGQLAQENEGVDIANLSQGKELLVSNVKTLLPVKAIREVSYSKEVPFPTERVNDDKLYVNRTKVLQKGKKGTELITAEVTLIDGEEIGREVLKTEVLAAPVTEKIAVGTKPLPPSAPTGTFMRPSDGYISSYFGTRWGSSHTGLDIAKCHGASIVAADGGKVTFTGWKGNYGLAVILDHGDGIQTMYAHCSEVLVSVGEEVPKGFEIAKMGSTGRSTGNHVHFEVIVNGVKKNPLNYLE